MPLRSRSVTLYFIFFIVIICNCISLKFVFLRPPISVYTLVGLCQCYFLLAFMFFFLFTLSKFYNNNNNNVKFSIAKQHVNLFVLIPHDRETMTVTVKCCQIHDPTITRKTIRSNLRTEYTFKVKFF